MRKKIYILFILCGLAIANCYSQNSCGDPPGGPQNPGGGDGPGGGARTDGVGPADPNLIVSPLGFSTPRWVSVNDNMGFIIYFENDPNLATAPVHNAYVYYKLKPEQDASTFRLGNYGFNGMFFTVPYNLNFYQTRLDLRDSLGLYVDVTAGINVVNNTAFWIFQSIDPLTNLPPIDPLTGFLPIKDTSAAAAEIGTSKGEGFVNFTVKPISTAQTRDTIFAQAQIVFDVNDTIPTNTEFNTIDALPPTSQMITATVVQDTIHLFWTGQDDNLGSGIMDYAVYYSENNGPYILYKDKITGLDTTFVGVHGRTYCFNTRARDNTGNTERLKDSCALRVTINLSTEVTCPGNSSVCINVAPYALTGGSPAGGTYSGTGVSAGNFSPSVAGVGAHEITYTTSAGSCTFTITVNPLPIVGCPGNSSVCISAAPFALVGGSPAGGTYSGSGVSSSNFDPATAGEGAHTITYSYTNPTTGCSNSCTFSITVNPLPTVSCPANLSVNLNTPVFVLTGGTPTGGAYSGTGVSGGQYDPASAGVGMHAITYTYTNLSTGCTNSCTYNITVNPPVSVVCPVSSSVCINAAPFMLTGEIPSGGIYSGPGVSGGIFNPAAAGAGAHIITYTATAGSCTFTITVNPLISAGIVSGTSLLCIGQSATYASSGTAGGTWSSSNPTVAAVNAASGLVTAVSAGTANIIYTAIGCGGPLSASALLTVGYNITATSEGNGTVTPAGTTRVDCNGRVTYTITPDPCYMISDVLIDGVSDPAAILSGTYTFNNVSANHTIHAIFALAGPFNIVATTGGNGTVLPEGTRTLACGGSQTYSIIPNPGFVIATVLIDGVNNPAAVASGTYTFTNVQMNHTIDATFVTACSPTTVTISESSPNDFCANLTLTANPATPGAYTYEWKRGAFVAGTSQTLALTTASPDGVYTVTAASGPACISAPASYTYAKQGKVQTYTILGLDKVELDEANTVLSGSAGSTKVGGEVHIRKNSVIASPGAFVKASKIKVDNPSNVPLRIFAPVMVTLPAMQYNTTSTAGLNNVTLSKTAMPFTLAGNYKDVSVKKGAIVTLTGSIYGKIKIEEGARVMFTGSVLNFEELEVLKGTTSLPTTVLFSSNCNVRLKKKVKIEENCRINTTASKNVVFYVAGENFEVKSKNTNIVASIYAPTKDINIDGDGPCNMTGRFIAKNIHGNTKNVTWNNYDCAAPIPVLVTIAAASGSTVEAVISKPELLAFPNPTDNLFYLKLKTDSKDEVVIKIISMQGKVVQELKGAPQQIFRVGEKFLPGIYFAELQQGKEKVTVKLVKQ